MKIPAPLVVVAFAAVTTSSYFAYAQLGGTAGVRIPYEGALDRDGVPVTGSVELTFEVFNVAVDGTACWTSGALDTTVTQGRFAVVLGPVTDSCVEGEDVYLAITVDDGSGAVALPGRQRVYPAVAALASGSGDFHVGGSLNVTAATNTASLTTTADATIGGGLFVGSYAKSCIVGDPGFTDECLCNDPANERVITGGVDCAVGGGKRGAVQYSHPKWSSMTGWYALCVDTLTGSTAYPVEIFLRCGRLR